MNLNTLLSAAVFAAMAVYAVRTGRAPALRKPLAATRATHPVAFWLVVALYSATALFLVWVSLPGTAR